MGDVQPFKSEPGEDWYGAITSSQPDGVGFGSIEREEFNHAIESYMSGSYDNAYQGFFKLSKQGSFVSQYYLGLMYSNGMGVLQDFCRAHKWLNLASSQGHKKARTHLEQLTQKMTADQLSEAQKRARRWVAKKKETLITD